MSIESVQEIPFFKLSAEALASGRKLCDFEDAEEYKVLCNKVRKACENYGCFLVDYDGFTDNLHEENLLNMKSLFDLPEETKKRFQSPKPYRSYTGKSPVIPLHESFGIDEAQQPDVAQDFTNTMWPQGNLAFCETMKTMSSNMLELNFTILKMILDSFGIGKLYESYVEDCTSLFRMMKYGVPSPSKESEIGLVAHTDKNFLTILCQNEVQGLEVVSKQGDWIKVMAPKNSFIVVVGDALKAWSNGRLHAARHRVVMSGNEERYSCALFTLPKDDVTVEVPQEMVDKEYPLHYRPFRYEDYISYFVSNISDDALEIYAGI